MCFTVFAAPRKSVRKYVRKFVSLKTKICKKICKAQAPLLLRKSVRKSVQPQTPPPRMTAAGPLCRGAPVAEPWLQTRRRRPPSAALRSWTLSCRPPAPDVGRWHPGRGVWAPDSRLQILSHAPIAAEGQPRTPSYATLGCGPWPQPALVESLRTSSRGPGRAPPPVEPRSRLRTPAADLQLRTPVVDTSSWMSSCGLLVLPRCPSCVTQLLGAHPQL